MPELSDPLAGAGDPRRRQEDLPVARRIGSWLIWWTLLMALWVLLDDSIALAELLAGAGAAALGASLAELVQHQAATQLRMRIKWLVPALGLPLQVGRDTILVLRVLWDRLVHGRDPVSGFREVPTSWGDETPEGVSRRVLLVGGRSVSPNTFVLGIDQEREVMVLHQLVVNQGRPSS
jgi:multisubunit Na+/H+ antiporter MnhE subunit